MKCSDNSILSLLVVVTFVLFILFLICGCTQTPDKGKEKEITPPPSFEELNKLSI